MVAQTVRLTCPGCGAKIEVTEDLSRFACAYCGNEVLVNRAGGAVSLIPVLEKVEDGTSKTASELAIVRLTGDIDKLKIEREPFAKVVKGFPSAVIAASAAGLICVAAFLLACLPDSSLDCFAWPMFGLGLGAIVWLLRKLSEYSSARPKLTSLDIRIKAKQDELDRHNEIVKG